MEVNGKINQPGSSFLLTSLANITNLNCLKWCLNGNTVLKYKFETMTQNTKTLNV